MLVEAEPSAVGEVEGTLRRLGGKGVTVAVQPTQPWLSDDDSPRCAGGVSYTGHLHATGPDRPGLMLRLTALLAEQQLDITKVSCHQHYQASLDGSGAPPRPVFRLDGVVRAFTPGGALKGPPRPRRRSWRSRLLLAGSWPLHAQRRGAWTAQMP